MDYAKEVFEGIISGDEVFCGAGAQWIISNPEHMIMLNEYANKCESVTEFGVFDWNTTWAFVNSNINKLRCYDGKIRGRFDRPNGGYQDLQDTCQAKGIDFKFMMEDTRKCDFEETDMLFIDTWHTYDQVRQELQHSSKVRKYIAFHDVVLYGKVGSGDEEGLLKGIYEFLFENYLEWEIDTYCKKGNGLLVIKRC